jgi:hypothetical protein
VIGKLNAAAVQALPDPAVRSRLAEQQTPDVLGVLMKADAEKWAADHQAAWDQGGLMPLWSHGAFASLGAFYGGIQVPID